MSADFKKAIKDAANRVFPAAESLSLIARLPGFVRGYHQDYPGLQALEAGHGAVRRECLTLLQSPDELTDVEALGGDYTQGGIHSAHWKAFMLKSGCWLEENCARAPQTAALLRGVPRLYTAFLSILYPGEYIRPHRGYWNGYVRYHLGVSIPNDNAEGRCWLRVNSDPADNAADDKSLVERGEVYHWHEGEGVLFCDNYLHDAMNDSNEIRVVLWLDIARKLPWPLDLYNRACLWVGYRDDSVKAFARNAATPSRGPAPAGGPG